MAKAREVGKLRLEGKDYEMQDGDTVDFSQIPKLPRSIRDLEILAVGDPIVGTLVGNHDSQQEAGILRRLAAELHGSYHNVNTQHVPSKALAELARVPPPPASVGWQLKDLARIALTIGAVLLALIPVALQYLGSAWNPDRELPGIEVGRVSRPVRLLFERTLAF